MAFSCCPWVRTFYAHKKIRLRRTRYTTDIKTQVLKRVLFPRFSPRRLSFSLLWSRPSVDRGLHELRTRVQCAVVSFTPVMNDAHHGYTRFKPFFPPHPLKLAKICKKNTLQKQILVFTSFFFFGVSRCVVDGFKWERNRLWACWRAALWRGAVWVRWTRDVSPFWSWRGLLDSPEPDATDKAAPHPPVRTGRTCRLNNHFDLATKKAWQNKKKQQQRISIGFWCIPPLSHRLHRFVCRSGVAGWILSLRTHLRPISMLSDHWRKIMSRIDIFLLLKENRHSWYEFTLLKQTKRVYKWRLNTISMAHIWRFVSQGNSCFLSMTACSRVLKLTIQVKSLGFSLRGSQRVHRNSFVFIVIGYHKPSQSVCQHWNENSILSPETCIAGVLSCDWDADAELTWPGRGASKGRWNTTLAPFSQWRSDRVRGYSTERNHAETQQTQKKKKTELWLPSGNESWSHIPNSWPKQMTLSSGEMPSSSILIENEFSFISF